MTGEFNKILKSYRHNFYSIENHGYWDCTRNALNRQSIMGRGEMVGKRMRKKRGMWGGKGWTRHGGKRKETVDMGRERKEEVGREC